MCLSSSIARVFSRFAVELIAHPPSTPFNASAARTTGFFEVSKWLRHALFQADPKEMKAI
ncbi:hypothetical protein MES5069_710017 [Mesorhizobium escarrei]|uniref:Uncharacterized protein n=1 Tax=Mesorhizobium escarrei TaxID=666018 RepID=A0ABN8KGB0_9HYPH|nr:hypothetical protein MES5069_710017 [Mesorhizobium escarrei]